MNSFTSIIIRIDSIDLDDLDLKVESSKIFLLQPRQEDPCCPVHKNVQP